VNITPACCLALPLFGAYLVHGLWVVLVRSWLVGDEHKDKPLQGPGTAGDVLCRLWSSAQNAKLRYILKFCCTHDLPSTRNARLRGDPPQRTPPVIHTRPCGQHQTPGGGSPWGWDSKRNSLGNTCSVCKVRVFSALESSSLEMTSSFHTRCRPRFRQVLISQHCRRGRTGDLLPRNLNQHDLSRR
jgi:hypothetical protein